MKIGFIGLGRMGTAMATRLVEADNDLTVYNRSPEKAKPFGEKGAKVAQSVAEACDGADVVITMMAHDAALSEVTLSKGGIADSLPKGAIHAASGTHGVDLMNTLKDKHGEAGQAFVAAPVLGRPERVLDGEAGLVSAGPKEAVEKVKSVFQAFVGNTFDAGEEPDAAAAVKITHNFVLGCAIEAMAEGSVLVRKYGVDARVLYDVLTKGLFDCPAYKIYGDIIAEEDWDRVGITAELALKDANLTLQAGQAKGVPVPSVSVWRDQLIDNMSHDEGQKDWSVLTKALARAAGLEK